MTNEISDSATLIGEVTIGTGNFIGPGAVIIGPIAIGNNNYFGPHCVVGTPPQDTIINSIEHEKTTLGLRTGKNRIKIGNNNIIREFVTVHQGLTSITEIENHCYLMSYVHIAHDCKISSNVKIANNVQMGGYSTILQEAYVGLSAVLHQFTIIGAFAMIGMASVVTRNIPPLGLVVGSPARVIKINQKALEKTGLNDFEWVDDYLKSPSLSNIHPKLQIYFQNYLDITSSRSKERKAITIYRKTLS